ncbi:MAG: alanine--glyoxylate aminotransferase family protein [Candidatus Firestonebacteria bacterium]|nr:alanine--glyoxylate aminotransferase family protein [Candidatus Firestonebacteria bacterium]
MLYKKRLMTPGPTDVPPSVLAEAAKPIMHHRTPQFRKILTEVVASLKRVFQTEGDLLIYPAAGTGGMEAAVVNLCSPGDHVLVASCGNFGNRWTEIAKAYGVQSEHYEVEWGQPVDPAEIQKRLAADPSIKVVFTTLSETSTGIESDIRAIGEIVAKTPAVLVVDAISGLGAIPLKTDAWKADVVIAGAQKGLMIPPGLALISISAKAWETAKNAKCPKYYFSWEKAQKAMKAEALADTPYTPSISLIIQLAESLRLIEAEGLEAVWERHARLAKATQAAMQALGLKLFAPKQASNAVTAVWVPEGVDVSKLFKTIRDVYGITLATGQGKVKGKIFRIGHLGYADDWDVVATVAAVERALLEQKYAMTVGSGVAAAEKVLFGI